MVQWAKENARLNRLEKAPIRWIVDDALKFLKREIKRGRKYDGIILDPPTFGRGAQGEIFQAETDINLLLSICIDLLSDHPCFLILSSHTPVMTPLTLTHLLQHAMQKNNLYHRGTIEAGEMIIEGTRNLPCGSFSRWKHP